MLSYFQALRNYLQRIPSAITIAFGLVLTVYHNFVAPVELPQQLVICALLLLVAGIPHGGLDHLVARERSARQRQTFSLVRFLAAYILQMVGYAACWYFFPVASLVLFVVISARHFGETDLESASDDLIWIVTRFVAGGFVVAFLLLTHASETTYLLGHLVRDDPAFMRGWQQLVAVADSLLVIWAMVLAGLIAVAFRYGPVSVNGWRLGRLGLILLMACGLPLLPAFMLYFGGWHALNSFGAIRGYLRATTFPNGAIWTLWRLSLPLTALAVLFMGICTLVWLHVIPDVDPVPGFFILVSLITLPHSRIMHHVNTPPSALT